MNARSGKLRISIQEHGSMYNTTSTENAGLSKFSAVPRGHTKQTVWSERNR